MSIVSIAAALAIATSAVLALGVSIWAARESRQAAQARIVSKLLEEYASPEMAAAPTRLKAVQLVEAEPNTVYATAFLVNRCNGRILNAVETAAGDGGPGGG